MVAGSKASLVSMKNAGLICKIVAVAAAFATSVGVNQGIAQVIGGPPSLSLGAANQGAAWATQQRVIPPPTAAPPITIPPVSNPLSQSTIPLYPESMEEAPGLWGPPSGEYRQEARHPHHVRKRKEFAKKSIKGQNRERLSKEMSICRGC